LVDQFFNTSTGQGDDGELDARGPWNQGGDLQLVEAPAFQALAAERGPASAEGAVDDRTTSSARDPEMIEQLLVEQLRDLLHAEGQLVKALPKMVKAARAESLRFALEHHLEETREHVERLKEAFGLVGVAAKGKPCKGMQGLIDEGEEVMEDGKELDDAAADLALIAAAQKVEHYEISAYGTARTMAGQIGLPAVAALLNKSLAEEEIADNLMTQLAREFMSESRTGMTKEPKRPRVAATIDDE
jgi:Mn-containing catalase